MSKVSASHLDGAFSRYVLACERLGLVTPGTELHLSHGSKINGIAFRVNVVTEFGGLDHPPAGEAFLGFTKGEAFEKLADRARVLEDVYCR